jgi:hypothetical protein
MATGLQGLCIVMQTENSIVTQNRAGLSQCNMLDKTEKRMLHKSDSLSKKAIVVQTAKTVDEQIR